MGALEVALFVLLQAKEEVVDVPGEKLKIPLVHVPVEGTSLRPYAIAKFETTWREFKLFYREDIDTKRIIDGITRPSFGTSYFGQVQTPPELLEDRKPTINLRWHSAMNYCDWLTAKTGRKFRLPTEAEWEHAARAGEKGADLKGHAWIGAGTRFPGTGTPNAWGLHDVLGNVWEVMLEPMAPPGFGPVYRGGSYRSPPAETTFTHRQRVPAEWFQADPNSPRSLWWLTSDFSQGMRVAGVGGPADLEASAAYAGKVKVVLKEAKEKIVPLTKEDKEKVESTASEFYRTITGEVVNQGDRTIEELELYVHYLTPDGKPHLMEKDGANKPFRPNFTWTYPVHVSSAHEGPWKAPLAPGQTRVFSVDLPKSWDNPIYVDEKGFAAKASWVRLK